MTIFQQLEAITLKNGDWQRDIGRITGDSEVVDILGFLFADESQAKEYLTQRLHLVRPRARR